MRKKEELNEADIDLILNCITFSTRKINLYGINCTSESIIPVKRALRERRIKSYLGLSTDEKEVQKMENGGLSALLIKGDEDVIRSLDALKKPGNGVVMMIDYSPEFNDKAKEYKKLANERGLRVYDIPKYKPNS
jgi:hypothetical protein